jgi:predicted hydrolase (HD superfamily)
VDRNDILMGAEELGRPLEEHIEFVVRALQDISPQLGL